MNANTSHTSGKGFNALKTLIILGLGLLFVVGSYFGYQLNQLSERQQKLKEDYANMNNIMLGLFSIEQWHDKIERIINYQSNNLDITPAQKKALQKGKVNFSS